MTVGAAEVAAAVCEIGGSGLPVCVHASLRSFGRLDKGANAVIDGMLAAGATMLVPSSTFRTCMGPRPPGVSRPFNAEDDGSIPADLPPTWWDPAGTATDPAMGTLPATVLKRTMRVRGDHPLSSFTALGPLAADLVAGQRPLDVYAPLRELAEWDGLVVGMGVGLDTITAVHLAERQAGLRLLRRWGCTRDGVVECEHGGCSRGFERLAEAVAGVESRFRVGGSTWRVWPVRGLLDAASAAFRRDPGAATCLVPGCARCRDIVAAAEAGYVYTSEAK